MEGEPPPPLAHSLSLSNASAFIIVLIQSVSVCSGLKFDWANFRVPAICAKKGWLLAGGLTPENVALAVSTLRPDAVDVSSGITGPDNIRKDPRRILAFMEAVRSSARVTAN